MEVIYPYPCNPSVDAVGGGIRYVLTLADHLARRGIQVHVLGCEAGDGGTRGYEDGEFQFTPISRRWEWWRFLGSLWRTVRSDRFFHRRALLHVQHPLFLAPFQGAWDRVGPRVCTFHGVPFRRQGKKHRLLHDLLEVMYRPIEGALLGQADYAIFVDDGTVAAMRTRLGALAGQHSVIPNGVDTDAFHPDPDSDVLDRWDVQEPYVMFSGRLSSQKNLPLLLGAVNLVAQELGEGNPSLIITGQGEKEGELRRWMSQMPGIDVRHLGSLPQADYRALLSQATAFVQASLYEASPLAIREALACGTPVATTDTGDVASFVDISVGRIAPPTRRGLASAIVDLLDRLSPSMRARCRKVAVQRLSIAAQVQSTLEVYTRLLA